MSTTESINITEPHPKFRRLLHPYEEFHSAGPYLRPGNPYGRMYINILYDAQRNIRGMLYARYLLEVSLGRLLKPGYEVDHIDGFNWNDSIDNLQELSSHQNKAKGRAKIFAELLRAKTHVSVKCPECGVWFDRLKSMMYGKLTFCSYRCSGLYKGDRNIAQEIKPISDMSTINIPKPYYEPFEQYSVPYTITRSITQSSKVCTLCGNICSDGDRKYCKACLLKQANAKQMRDNELRDRIMENATAMYANEGKIAMSRLGPILGFSDNGLRVIIRRIFKQSPKEFILQLTK